jgi:hypothetical protein
MIANPNWFSMRKYGGWGLTPNCWQGWLYIGLCILPFIILNQLTLPENLKTFLLVIYGSIFAIDFLTIIFRLKKDERETLHEALAERNAMWFMITALSIGIIYQSAISITKQSQAIDPIIIIALLGATITKALTHLYLKDK